MKMHRFIASVVLTVISSYAQAAWQVSTPSSVVPREPYFHTSTRKVSHAPSAYAAKSFPNQYARLGSPAPAYAISIRGSLKTNLERILRRYHWRVVWKAPYDYNFDGRVTGSSLANTIQKVLQPFPLQAVMYKANRTVTIVPRRLA